MMKTSYSTIFNEGLDFSTMLLDREGNLIAEKNFTPSMMGAINYTVRWTLEELGEDFFQPGDVVVHNDPYRGNCHIPEHMLMKPIFRGERADRLRRRHRPPGRGRRQGAGQLRRRRDRRLPGGPAPAAGEAASRAGDYNEQLWRVILANHRTPRNTWGDFHAMIGALNIGERRLLELVDRYDLDTVVEGARRLIDYSERRLRAEIAELPEGTLRGLDDGRGRRRRRPTRSRSRSSVVIRGDEVIADFTGSSPQVRGPMNCTFVVAAVGALQRRLLRRRSAGADPAQLRLLPADPDHRAAGHGRERPHPGPVGRRQHRSAAEADRPPARRVRPGRAGARRGGDRRLEQQPALRRRPSGDRPLLQQLPLRRHGRGRHRAQGRQRRRDHAPLELPQHAGRGLRAPLSAADARATAWRRTPAARASIAAGSAPSGRFRITAPEITFSALFDRCKLAPHGPLRRAARAAARRCWSSAPATSEFRSFDEVFGVASPTKFTNVVLHRGRRALLPHARRRAASATRRARSGARPRGRRRRAMSAPRRPQRDYGVAARAPGSVR